MKRVLIARPVSERAQIFRDPADGVWLVQLPGRETPSLAAQSAQGALDALRRVYEADDYWRQQDPLRERGADVPPRSSSFAGPRPRRSLWEYLGARSVR